jgi:uncharacterized protein DUF4242
MPFVIVEYDYDPPVTDEQLQRISTAFAPCAAVRRIRKLRSIISADRRRGYCEFEAADVETVREAFRSAGIAFRSAWAAELYDFDAPTRASSLDAPTRASSRT